MATVFLVLVAGVVISLNFAIKATREADARRNEARQRELAEADAIKAKEDELEALGNARFSVVMGLLNDWRGLVLKAEFERVESLEADPRRRA